MLTAQNYPEDLRGRKSVVFAAAAAAADDVTEHDANP